MPLRMSLIFPTKPGLSMNSRSTRVAENDGEKASWGKETTLVLVLKKLLMETRHSYSVRLMALWRVLEWPGGFGSYSKEHERVNPATRTDVRLLKRASGVGHMILSCKRARQASLTWMKSRALEKALLWAELGWGCGSEIPWTNGARKRTKPKSRLKAFIGNSCFINELEIRLRLNLRVKEEAQLSLSLSLSFPSSSSSLLAEFLFLPNSLCDLILSLFQSTQRDGSNFYE